MLKTSLVRHSYVTSKYATHITIGQSYNQWQVLRVSLKSGLCTCRLNLQCSNSSFMSDQLATILHRSAPLYCIVTIIVVAWRSTTVKCYFLPWFRMSGAIKCRSNGTGNVI